MVTPLHTLQFAVQATGCADPPVHNVPVPQSAVEHVPATASQALDVVEVEAYPTAHAQGTAWASLPAQLNPAPHTRQVPFVPEHAVEFVDEDAYPAVHVHAMGCAAAPAHAFPAVHVEHVPVVDVHSFDVVDVDVQPGKHEHEIAWALSPVQLKPAPHATQVPLVPAHAVVFDDIEEYPGLQLQGSGCDAPPAHTLPAEQPVVEHVDEVMTHALEVVAGEAKPGEHEHNAA